MMRIIVLCAFTIFLGGCYRSESMAGRNSPILCDLGGNSYSHTVDEMGDTSFVEYQPSLNYLCSCLKPKP